MHSAKFEEKNIRRPNPAIDAGRRTGTEAQPSPAKHEPRSGALRGFAAMSPPRRREIASLGGRAAHVSGVAHEFDSAEAREAGRKGGTATSRDRAHMAMIGQRGARSRVQRHREIVC